MRHLPPMLSDGLYDFKLTLKVLELKIKNKDKKVGCGIFLQWWGETTPLVLKFPQFCGEYVVASCSWHQYLKFCQVVEFAIFRVSDEDIIAGAFLNTSLITTKSFTSLPVVDHSGNSIGRINVNFVMQKIQSHALRKLNSLNHTRVQNPQVNGPLMFPQTKENSFQANQKVTKKVKYGIALEKRKSLAPVLRNHETLQLDSPNLRNDKSDYINDKCNSPIHKSTYTCPKSPPSVKIKLTDNLVTFNQLSTMQLHVPKVVDFLLGKKLSKDEERFALITLNRMSPNPDFVQAVTRNCERLPMAVPYSYNDYFMPSNKLQCLHSEIETPQKCCFVKDDKPDESLTTSRSNYNLDNSIELAYYKKFFSKNMNN